MLFNYNTPVNSNPTEANQLLYLCIDAYINVITYNLYHSSIKSLEVATKAIWKHFYHKILTINVCRMLLRDIKYLSCLSKCVLKEIN